MVYREVGFTYNWEDGNCEGAGWLLEVYVLLILLHGGNLYSDRDLLWKIICAKDSRLATGNRRRGLDWKWLLTFYHGCGLSYNE